MELTDIILSVLLLTGLLFLSVVFLSYAISKTKSNSKDYTKENFNNRPIKIIEKQRFDKQNTLRVNSSEINQRIINSNNLKQIQNTPKIIKISTSQNSSFTIEEIEERKKNSNGSRYSIVNDKINKIKIKAANFYL